MPFTWIDQGPGKGRQYTGYHDIGSTGSCQVKKIDLFKVLTTDKLAIITGSKPLHKGIANMQADFISSFLSNIFGGNASELDKLFKGKSAKGACNEIVDRIKQINQKKGMPSQEISLLLGVIEGKQQGLPVSKSASGFPSMPKFGPPSLPKEKSASGFPSMPKFGPPSLPKEKSASGFPSMPKFGPPSLSKEKLASGSSFTPSERTDTGDGGFDLGALAGQAAEELNK
jgi:hypothetical protein